ncbi:MAG: leucine-rich repeat protein [Ruminococcus flavefaciens]|nr:leucine-rich repeat protein [Ruminococcus flavefaciens]MCM1228949.1 leucine-rich repeat protein [Ruminococcus flavefaciens]
MDIKKITAGILLCCVVGGALPITVSSDIANTAVAVESDQVDSSLTYLLQNSGAYYAITGFDNSVSSVEIPAEIDSIPVRVIDEKAFQNATKLESITIAEGITDIKSYAFSGCTSLKEIHLPSTLTSIYKYAFQKCISLEDIDIPNGVKTIGDGAFSDCTNLLTLEFPSGISEISAYVADNCRNLQSVVINNGPTSIGDCSFRNCTKLKTVSIPTSIMSIAGNFASSDYRSFLNCSAITDVYYAGNSDQWSIIKNTSYNFSTSNSVHYGEKAPTIGNYKKGDMNGDGVIDASDASEILAYYAYLSTGGTLDYDEYKEQM